MQPNVKTEGVFEVGCYPQSTGVDVSPVVQRRVCRDEARGAHEVRHAR